MKNQEIANIFFEIADYLEADNISFKPYAYRKAALVLDDLEEDIEEVYKKGGIRALKEMPGIGESIALKIEEYLKTGKIKYCDELKKEMPVDLREIAAIEGMGPKRAKILYQKLKIRTLKDLEKAAKSHKIAPLFGFGEKTEKNILQGIEFLKKSRGRFLLGDILPRAKEIEEKLKNLKEVEKIEAAGSLRRKKETIGDVDFLVIPRFSNKNSFLKAARKIMDYFVSLDGVIKIWGKGDTKSSVRFGDGFDVDIRVLPKESYGAALQYFTGSKEHNIALRKIAMAKKLKLSEYGLFSVKAGSVRGRKDKEMIAGANEEDIYRALQMEWIPPEIRENRGEIESAIRSFQGSPGLPRLIESKDIKGDLHCHSKWNGGVNTIKEMAQEAIKMNYHYLGIADHTKFLKIEQGLDEKDLALQKKEIDKINLQLASEGLRLRILQGCEANILNDGLTDIEDESLKKLDFVIAGVHHNFKMPKEKMTERIIKAMKNPHIDIISHPTGRIIQKREEYQIDIERVFKAAKATNTILEINSYPERLDLNDINIKRAVELGVKLVINSDAHHKDQLRYMEFGVYQARRGWAEKKDIINTCPLNKLRLK